MLDLFQKSNPPKSAFSGSSPVGQKLAAEGEKNGKYQWKDAPLSITEIVSTCLDVAFGAANGGHDSGFASLGNHTLQGGQGAHKGERQADGATKPAVCRPWPQHR